MILKEAYRYMNYLNGMFDTACDYLGRNDFVTTTVQVHNKNKINPDAENETIKVRKNTQVEFTPNDVINFVVKVMDEKEKVSDAITKAKRTTEIDIDHSVSMNKNRQNLIMELKSLDNIKNSEKIINATGYKINQIDGNQVSYYYEIEEKKTIDFDRNDIKKLIKKYNNECDVVSSKLDRIQIDTLVDFTPRWDINDSFEDIVCS